MNQVVLLKVPSLWVPPTDEELAISRERFVQGIEEESKPEEIQIEKIEEI